MSHPGRLENKVAIITGGGLGLGEGIARKFVHEGAKVLLFEINKTNGAKVADSLGSDKATPFEGDVTNLDDWDTAVKHCLDKFGGLDIVVNNAGVGEYTLNNFYQRLRPITDLKAQSTTHKHLTTSLLKNTNES